MVAVITNANQFSRWNLLRVHSLRTCDEYQICQQKHPTPLFQQDAATCQYYAANMDFGTSSCPMHTFYKMASSENAKMGEFLEMPSLWVRIDILIYI